MENHDVTTNEIMEFLQEHMVTRAEFNGLDQRVYSLDQKVCSLDQKVQQLDVKINQVKLDLLDAMDQKLGSMKGDIVVMMRNEDQKVMLVVKKLKEKKIFGDDDVEEFMRLLPFPQIVRPF